MTGNVLVTLPIHRTGDFPHTDVSFDPWNPRRFAIVDSQGHWSVWNLKNSVRSKEVWEALEVWIGNQDRNTIIVALRTSLVTLSLDDPRRLHVIDLNLAKTGERILDLKRRPSDKSYFLVATTSRIILLWARPDVDPNSSYSNLTVLSVLSWKHFRNQQDVSLKLSVLEDVDGEPSPQLPKPSLLIRYSNCSAAVFLPKQTRTHFCVPYALLIQHHYGISP